MDRMLPFSEFVPPFRVPIYVEVAAPLDVPTSFVMLPPFNTPVVTTAEYATAAVQIDPAAGCPKVSDICAPI